MKPEEVKGLKLRLPKERKERTKRLKKKELLKVKRVEKMQQLRNKLSFRRNWSKKKESKPSRNKKKLRF